MPRTKAVPSYRYHKARKCAVVTLDGRNHYLGRFDSPESKALYAEKILEWQRMQSATPPVASEGGDYTIGQLAVEYTLFARSYYVKDGEETTQVMRIKEALKPLVSLYEELPAATFGPTKLKNVQQHFVNAGLCRTYINSLIGCIRRMFRWAAAEEKFDVKVYEALRTVDGLKKGRTAAPEAPPVLPVDEATVLETIKYLSPTVATMVQLQLLTGARPGEICSMRPCDVTFSLDGTGCYRPASHKTEHHGRERRVYLGPQAIAVLKPFLDREPEEHCFSPAESIAWHRSKRRAERKTPKWPSHDRRNETKRRARPKRVPRSAYTVIAYNRAIARGCEAAFEMPSELRTVSPKLKKEVRDSLLQKAREWRAANCWAANRLRHTAATKIRKQFGIEAAQVTLGHSDPKTAEIYAERNFEAAARIMAEVG